MAASRRNAGKAGTWEVILGATFLGVTIVVFGLGIWVGRSVGPPSDTATDRVVRADSPARPPDADIPQPVGPEFYREHQRAIEERLAAPDEEAPDPAAAAVEAATPEPTPASPASTPTPTTAPPAATRTATRTPTTRPTASPTRRLAPPAPTATAAAPVRRPSGNFVVYVGETRSEQQAFAWVGDLRALGFTATTDERIQQGARVYVVRVGPFDTRDAATDAARRIVATGRYPDAFAAFATPR